MVMKLPKEFCIDEFVYEAYANDDERYSEPVFDEPLNITNCRIDRGAEFTAQVSGKQLLYNAVIFCYAGITTPLPKFKTQSKVHFDNQEHRIVKVIPVYEPFANKLYAYELEVV